jgi:simple sugar transport system substrate-binding protein
MNLDDSPADNVRRRLLAVTAAVLCARPALVRATPNPLKAAFVYAGPVGNSGWNFSHDLARKAVERSFGMRLRTQIVESVDEGISSERVFRDLIAQDVRLIFATSFGYMNSALKVAAEFPDVKFEHATGLKTAANLRTYDVRSYEAAYLAGIIAGAQTRTNQIGVVGAMPTPEVVRMINALTMGALSTNPAAVVRVVWVDDWANPPRETEAAQTLVNQNCDVLMQTTDSSAVLQVAERLGKQGFGLSSDMSRLAPHAHLGSAIFDWTPYYSKAIRDVLEGHWSPGRVWWGIKEGLVDLVGVPDRVPAAVRLRVETVRSGLRDGSFSIWQGPLQDNTGKIVLANGQRASDDFLQHMQFYVKGVQGRVPEAGR